MKRAIRWTAAEAARLLPTRLRTAFYRVPWLSRMIRKVLNQAAPSGLNKVQVAAGGLKGKWLYLDLQKEKDYWLGTYEVDLQETIRTYIKPGMVVYDVGANIGYISLLLNQHVGTNGHIFSFEALPANIKRLQQNIEANQAERSITVVPAAVTASSQPVQFLVHPSTSMGKAVGSAGRTDQAYMQEISVEGISLDDFIFQKGNLPPSAIKMDIEGGEVMAVEGMAHLLNEYHPVMLVELHGQQAARKVGSTLMAAGYSLYLMEPGYPLVEKPEDLEWKSYVIGVW